MDENKLLKRITINPKIFNGKLIIRGRRLAVEHILGMLGAGDSIESILEAYPWLAKEDIQFMSSLCPQKVKNYDSNIIKNRYTYKNN